MTSSNNHPNRTKPGILLTSDGRTNPSYAVLERLSDGYYCTYMSHHHVGGETRVSEHRTYAEAKARFDALEVAAFSHR